MSDLDYLNLSTDLRRVSLWLQEGRVGLAGPFIRKSLLAFGHDKKMVGKREIGEWLKRISDYKTRDWKSAEDALTLSVLLKNRFG